MAKPIKVTPLLKGKDAVNFHNSIELNKEKKIDKELLLSVQANAKLLRSILKK